MRRSGSEKNQLTWCTNVNSTCSRFQFTQDASKGLGHHPKKEHPKGNKRHQRKPRNICSLGRPQNHRLTEQQRTKHGQTMATPKQAMACAASRDGPDEGSHPPPAPETCAGKDTSRWPESQHRTVGDPWSLCCPTLGSGSHFGASRLWSMDWTCQGELRPSATSDSNLLSSIREVACV